MDPATSGIRQTYIPGVDMCVIGGKISESLNLKYTTPLLKVISSVDKLWRLEFVLDYYGIRYHLFMQESRQREHCLENRLLGEITKDLNYSCLHEEDTWKCLDLFWPFVAQDARVREQDTGDKPKWKTRFQKKEAVRIQLLTGQDGSLMQVFHNEASLYPLSEPIMNPCPDSIRVYDMDEIELLGEIFGNVFKARIGEDIVCVKAGRAKEMQSEIDALLRVPSHANIRHPLLGVVGAGDGRIDKLIMPFIDGKQLLLVREATVGQKEGWKKQVCEAVHCLHKAGVAWGDVAARNVMIEKRSGEAILIDFGLSCSRGRERSERSCAFDGEKMKDRKALVHLKEFIDRIPFQSTGTEQRQLGSPR